MECWIPTGTPERTAGNILLWNDQFGRTGFKNVWFTLVFFPISFQISVVLAEVLCTVYTNICYLASILGNLLDFRNLAEINLFPTTGLRGRTPCFAHAKPKIAILVSFRDKT